MMRARAGERHTAQMAPMPTPMEGKDGGPPELSARLSFHGFASRALPPGKTMKG